MSFQPVPPQSDLQASIPAGRSAVALRSYAKPTPAFGPGSASYTEHMAEEMQRLGLEGREDEGASPPSAPSAAPPEGTYAGAGQYF